MSDEDTQPSASEMPEQPKTAKIAAADPVLIILHEIKRDVGEARADIALVSNDLGLLKSEVRIIQTWKGDVDARLGNNSMRAKAESLHDVEQDTRLDTLGTKVDTLLAIGERLDKLAKNPVAKAIGGLIALAIVSYAAAHGITINK